MATERLLHPLPAVHVLRKGGHRGEQGPAAARTSKLPDVPLSLAPTRLALATSHCSTVGGGVGHPDSILPSRRQLFPGVSRGPPVGGPGAVSPRAGRAPVGGQGRRCPSPCHVPPHRWHSRTHVVALCDENRFAREPTSHCLNGPSLGGAAGAEGGRGLGPRRSAASVSRPATLAEDDDQRETLRHFGHTAHQLRGLGTEVA